MLRRRAFGHIAGGLILVAVGISISVGTYVGAASNPYGGSYFITFGPILVGALWFVRGVMLLIRSSRFR
ncbi:MAG TPA: hypothetical protein VEK76_09175 [Candidatus Binatia bacterium]|nr:hypothetical protein [Candidatus Binatia bacterium]